jgi:hypothetical protein
MTIMLSPKKPGSGKKKDAPAPDNTADQQDNDNTPAEE